MSEQNDIRPGDEGDPGPDIDPAQAQAHSEQVKGLMEGLRGTFLGNLVLPVLESVSRGIDGLSHVTDDPDPASGTDAGAESPQVDPVQARQQLDRLMEMARNSHLPFLRACLPHLEAVDRQVQMLSGDTDLEDPASGGGETARTDEQAS